MPTHSRPYADPADAERMRAMLVATRAIVGPACWHVGDLVWRLFLHGIRHDLAATHQLWEDETGMLLGFAVFSPPRTMTAAFELQVHPQARGRGIEDAMLDWVEARWREAAEPSAAPLRLSTDAGVYEDDMAQLAALARRGFARTGNDGLLLQRRLADLFPAPSLPAGYAVRPIAGEHEIPQRAGAHREAFHPSRVTDESYARLMGTAGYERDLDLVAIAPDGKFAAFCIGWLDEVNRVGEFEPVGTCPTYRRRGLAQAVLLEGLRRMCERGAESAIVGPIDATDDDVLALYRSVGFRPISRVYAFVKQP
jgi:ribosomal protein S18 acetylase RimI-like enzyme